MLAGGGLPQGASAMLRIDHADHPREEWRPGVETRMLISALTGAKELCIFEQWVAPSAGTPVHAHPVEEVLTVLSGEAEMWLDDSSVIVTAAQSLVVPALRRHRFRNSGSSTLHIHAVLASPVFEAQVEGREAPVRRWMPATE